jgi:HSP20 family protein
MLTRWEPFGDLRGEMNRLYDEMTRVFERRGNGGYRPSASNVFPPLNLWEDESHLFVEAELPGFELGELEIYVTGEKQLSIKGERKRREKEGGTWHRQERGYGAFSRAVELPVGVESDRVSAELKNGVLTITLPKRAEVKPRRIEVKSS